MSTIPTCTYCGTILITSYDRAKRSPPDLLTKDHLIPLGRGGGKSRDNYVIACYQCNQDKGPLTEEEYRSVMHDRKLLKEKVREIHSTLNINQFSEQKKGTDGN
jgi:5-methylcytosine-specific restriction endonuclease McrA